MLKKRNLRRLFVMFLTGLMIIGITSAAYAVPDYIIAGDSAYLFTDYRNAGATFQSTVKSAMATNSATTFIEDSSDKVIKFLDFRNVSATGYAAKLAACTDKISELPTSINVKNTDGTIRSAYTPPGATAGPTLTAGIITAADTDRNITIATGGLTGTLDLSSLATTDTITTGSITVTTGATLTISAITGQDGTDHISLLTDNSKPVTQVLTTGANELSLITYLGTLDGGNDGVQIGYLRLLFGNYITINGTLGTSNVSLVITI